MQGQRTVLRDWAPPSSLFEIASVPLWSPAHELLGVACLLFYCRNAGVAGAYGTIQALGSGHKSLGCMISKGFPTDLQPKPGLPLLIYKTRLHQMVEVSTVSCVHLSVCLG